MATRSGGTGILATLVIFVIATVGLLVTSVLLFNAKSAVERERDDARSKEADQRQVVARLQATAAAAAQALGTSSIEDADIRSALSVGPSDQVADVLSSLRAEIARADSRVRGLQEDLARAQAAATADRTALEEAQATFAQGIADARADADRLNDLMSQFAAGLQEVRDSQAQVAQDLRRDFDDREEALMSSLDEAITAKANLETRLDKAESALRSTRLRAKDATSLIDARIVEVAPNGTTVFLDLGRRDQVRPGMTFDVYGDAAHITGSDGVTQSEGKATVEVVRVGDTTCEAKVTRLRPRTSIQRDDVLANPLYSPDQTYAFLVHGRFDINGDGIPSDAEADIVRQMLRDWNGRIVQGTELGGDVDFLVIGARPIQLPEPTDSASEEQFAGYAEAEAIRQQYEEVLRAALEAHIPVLNWNRLQVLTGATER